MKKNIRYSSYEDLNTKQFIQLLRLCKEFQPYILFEDVVFLEFIEAVRKYCDSSFCPFCKDKERFDGLLMGNLNKIKAKFYFNGIKANKKNLTNRQVDYIAKYIPRIKVPTFAALDGYRPVEKVLFLKVVRACRDFMRAKMSKDAETLFFEQLNIVCNAMNPL